MSALILLIEDNLANLDLMRYLLRASGYSTLTAADVGAGLETARRELPHLIVCDVQPPVVDGCEAARLLRASPELRSVPLVAVIAPALVGDRERVLAAGFDSCIAQPIDPDSFVRQLEFHLRPVRRTAAIPSDGRTAIPERPAVHRTILVVDTDPGNRDGVRGILEPGGYRVCTADSIARGLVLARQHSCDLILSDVCLAGETGYDFIRAVKADPLLSAIPFVFLTSAVLNEQDRVKGLVLGATRYLFRPVEPNDLLAVVEVCLREREEA